MHGSKSPITLSEVTKTCRPANVAADQFRPTTACHHRAGTDTWTARADGSSNWPLASPQSTARDHRHHHDGSRCLQARNRQAWLAEAGTRSDRLSGARMDFRCAFIIRRKHVDLSCLPGNAGREHRWATTGSVSGPRSRSPGIGHIVISPNNYRSPIPARLPNRLSEAVPVYGRQNNRLVAGVVCPLSADPASSVTVSRSPPRQPSAGMVTRSATHLFTAGAMSSDPTAGMY